MKIAQLQTRHLNWHVTLTHHLLLCGTISRQLHPIETSSQRTLVSIQITMWPFRATTKCFTSSTPPPQPRRAITHHHLIILPLWNPHHNILDIWQHMWLLQSNKCFRRGYKTIIYVNIAWISKKFYFSKAMIVKIFS